MEVSFGRLEWLLALVPLALGAWWLGRTRHSGILFAPVLVVREQVGAGAEYLARLPGILRASVLILLIFALAQPRSGGSVVEDESLGIPIVITIDLSSSMLDRDLATGATRLEIAKETIRKFVAGREDDPISLVAFAEDALTVVPLTTNLPVLLSALGDLQVGLLDDGTAVGEGLSVAANRLRAASGESRVIILMSDGESNRGATDPLLVARAAATLGIRVFTIGVGSDPAAVDENLLSSIAETTGGEFFRATDAAALETIYDRIDSLVQMPVSTRRYIEYTHWQSVLVLFAAGLLVCEWLLRGSRFGVVP